MALNESQRAYQARRDERYRDQGWAGYGQFRQAQKLGYSTPAQYHAAKAARPAVTKPIAASPFAPKRKLRGGGKVGTYGARVGIEVPNTEAGADALWRELGRYRDNRRIDVWIGDSHVFKRGMSLAYFKEQVEAAGGIQEFIVDMASNRYQLVGSPATISATLT